jgi:hypothetical protein
VDPNTDIGKIVSQKPISRDSTSNVDLYTYVPDAESPNTRGNIQETQSAASILKTMKESAVWQEIGLSRHTSLPLVSGPSSTPIYHISAPKTQSYHATSTQHQGFDNGVGIQDGSDKVAGSNSVNPPVASFTPIRGATEGAEFRFPIQEQGEANMMDVTPVSIGIDGANLWWDQNFNEYESDPFGFLHGEYSWNDGGNYFVYG